MPYSFTKIQKDKSATIGFVFFFLIVFYFIFCGFIYTFIRNIFLLFYRQDLLLLDLPRPDGLELTIVFCVAIIVAILHYFWTTSHLLEKVLRWLNAKAPDKNDAKECLLMDVVADVSAATGGKQFICVVIPIMALNAFALDDEESVPVIGVTKGALIKLNRSQLEAVVAHQAAHILNGDCFHATLISSIFEFYTAPFNKARSNQFERLKHEFEWLKEGWQFFRVPFIGVYLLIILILIFFTMLLSTLMRMFISREAKLRADALAVQLTRNPLSLAQAITILANQWRGSGVAWDGLEGVFFVNPHIDKIDEMDGFWADLFSTHPPIQNRLRVLLSMAHVDEGQFNIEMQRSDQADNIVQDEEAFPIGKWFLQNEKQWYGPFTLIEIGAVEWLRPDTLVKVKGAEQIIRAGDDPDLKSIAINKSRFTPGLCPSCDTPLTTSDYEGLEIRVCVHCSGKLLNEDQVWMVLNRRREKFTEDILLIARSTAIQKDLFNINKDFNIKRQQSFLCPNCSNQKNRMITRFFNPMQPVIIDKCNACGGVWFEKDELEVLQAIFEKNNSP